MFFLSVKVSFVESHYTKHDATILLNKMWREIGQVFKLLGTMGDGCRCVLLMGNGKAFSAGLDVSDRSLLMNYTEESDVARRGLAFRPKIIEMQRSFTSLEECPVPIIAAIHGPCVGAGIDLVCCTDVRLCSQCARFSVREVRLGLAADVGTLQRLPKICGNNSLVRQLCLTGDDFDATVALKMGLVSAVARDQQDLMQIALAMCKRIASNSPVAVVGTKLSLNYSRDHAVADGLDHIATHNSMALMSDDLIKSFEASSANKSEATYENLLPHSKL